MSSSAGYEHRRSAFFLESSSSLEEPGNFVVDDCYMLEPQLFNLRKRQLLEGSPHLDGFSPALLKKSELNRPHSQDQSQTPPAFWDNLSKIWLTKRGLKELDRRNTQFSPGPYRPVTPCAVTGLKQNHQSTEPASDVLRCCTPRCLKNIKSYAKHGGPDLLDLRGYSKPLTPSHAMNSNQFNSQSRKQGLLSILNTQPTTITTRTKSTGPYDRNFLQNLIDHGVYPEEYEYPDGRDPPAPNNWEEINQRLAQPRPSLSPFLCPEETFKKFNRANKHASKENRVTDSVIPIIEGEIRDGRCVSGGIPLTNLDHLTDGALSSGNPDRYYGARPEQLNPKIRDQLSGTIVPSTQTDLPIAPSFFLATKGPDGSVSVARRQACYDGALGARGIQSLQSYGHAEPVYDNNAYTITSTYYDGQLKLYTSFPVQPANPGGRPEYYMKQLKAYAMTCDSGVFRQGVAAYRNARDWAKEKRDALIEAANGKFSGTCNRSQSLESSGYKRAFTSSAKAVSMESDTSADELVLDAEQMYSSFSKRPRREVSESNRESGGSI